MAEELEDDLLLVASQMYEVKKEESLRKTYDYMQDEDFTLDRLMKNIPAPAEDYDQRTETERKDSDCKENVHPNSRFAIPVTESAILEKINGTIAKAMRKSTTWAVNTWEQWSNNRRMTNNQFSPKLFDNERRTQLLVVQVCH